MNSQSWSQEQLMHELMALRRTERRYHQLLDEMNDGYVITRRDWILFANRAAGEMLDLAVDQLIGQSWKQFFELELVDYIERTPMVDLPPVIKTELVRPGGSRLAVELAVRSASYNDELAEFTLVRDITEQIQVSTALQESEEKYRTLFESSPESITLVSLDGTILDCNQATCHIAGLPKDQMIGKSFAELGTLPDQDIPYYTQLISQIVHEHPTHPLQVETIYGSNQTRWLEVFPVLLKRDDQAHAIQIIARDVTERRQAEEALRQRNRELALINRIGQVFSSILDLDQVLITVLQEMCRLLGVMAASVWLIDPQTRELVCRQAIGPQNEVVRGWRLGPGEGLAGWVAQSGESLIVPDTQADERHFAGVDRQTGLGLRSLLSVPLQARQDVIGVIQVGDTQVDCFSSTSLALVESLAVTAAIAIENARLFAVEQEQVAALARTLEQQQELDRLKSELIWNVSHELRTPLAIARGHAELLECGELGELQPHQRESVTVIARRARMLSQMMDDIAAIIDVETHQFRHEPVNLAELVREMLVDCQAAAEQAGLTLTAQVAYDLTPLVGDPDHLKRMVNHLLNNALKFTSAGGQITVRLEQENQHMTLEVRDTGIGIPSDQLGRIFERFYQIDGSATRRYGGIGLGLALVKEIVQAHGGQVDVESKPGQGSVFRISLPLASDQAQRKAPSPARHTPHLKQERPNQ